jgi:hypothetical protein
VRRGALIVLVLAVTVAVLVVRSRRAERSTDPSGRGRRPASGGWPASIESRWGGVGATFLAGLHWPSTTEADTVSRVMLRSSASGRRVGRR